MSVRVCMMNESRWHRYSMHYRISMTSIHMDIRLACVAPHCPHCIDKVLQTQNSDMSQTFGLLNSPEAP